MDFRAALRRSLLRTKSVLLGNGFSLALVGSIFSYSNLRTNLDHTKFTLGNHIDDLFQHLGTDDFEEVIKQLEVSSFITTQYGQSGAEMAHDANELRKELVNGVATEHPDHPWDSISQDNYDRCAKFLRHFEALFTVNYDLLLYWTILRGAIHDTFRDGFQKRNGALVWTGPSQNTYYLHGALHIFEIDWSILEDPEEWAQFQGYDITKIVFQQGGQTLKDQISERLDQKVFPLTVAEGDSTNKEQKILKHPILRAGLDKLRQSKGVLFTFGISFAKDDHIIRAIAHSQITDLYVGIHDPNALAAVQARLSEINVIRGQSHRRGITLRFYDSNTAPVWQ
jgi:hypothetical protein